MVTQNLVHLIKDKNAKGVRVDLAYDRDGKTLNDKGVAKLRKQVIITREFAFAHDFEAAFPPEILAPAVTDYLKKYKDKALECSVADVAVLLAKRNAINKADRKALVAAIQEKYDISISKPQLAEFIFVHFAELGKQDDRIFMGAGKITGTEVSKFLRFVIDWPEDVCPAENEDPGEVCFPEDYGK